MLWTPEQCEVTAAGSTFQWAPDQASNAAAITAIAIKRDLPPRAATIAIATAMQESKVRNITYGDRDSLGLFQQRPSQGWGTPEQILNPEYSTNKFYDALVKVESLHGHGDHRRRPGGAALGRGQRLRPARGAGAGHGIRAVRPDPCRDGVSARGPGSTGRRPLAGDLIEQDLRVSRPTSTVTQDAEHRRR